MRRTDWPSVLACEIEAARGRPFSYGEHDCATWAFDVRHALIGGDNPAEQWRGRYRTEIGCARVMRRLGWVSVENLARSLLGEPLESVLLAQRGDIVFADGALGLSIGKEAAFIGNDGLKGKLLRDCALAWRV